MVRPYNCIWEFEVTPEHRAEFEHVYGPGGSWVQLFRRSPGHIETLLLKHESVAGRYLTIDRWQSKEAYLAFRLRFAGPYAQLDAECKHLAVSERVVGIFSECG